MGLTVDIDGSVSRRIMGWHMEGYMREELVIVSLSKAHQTRSVKPGLIAHSDRGGQYVGSEFRRLLVKRKIDQYMSRADDPYNNVAIKSFFSRLKAELVENGMFDSAEDARAELFEFIITKQSENIQA